MNEWYHKYKHNTVRKPHKTVPSGQYDIRLLDFIVKDFYETV